MLASAHQPHFFPWPLYFLKILKSDYFVLLDDVQYRKNYFQNRCQILNQENNAPTWLTIPVKKKSSSKSRINEIVFSEKFNKNSILESISKSYSTSPYFEQIFPDLKKILLADHKNLCELNIDSLMWCLDKLDIKTKILISSQLHLLRTNDPSVRLINICKYLNADEYLAGSGGLNYMDTDLFKTSNIKISWFDAKIEANQYDQNSEFFIPGLSILDMFFNIGFEESTNILHRNKEI